MKTKLLQLAFLLAVFPAIAQEKKESPRHDDEQQTLFRKGRPIGFFVGFENKPSVLNTQPAWYTGGKVAISFGHSLNIGFAGYGLINPVESNLTDPSGVPYYYDMGYGGFLIEPILGSKHLVHLTFPIVLGAGGVGFRQGYNNYSNGPDWSNYHADAFFVAEPGVNLELNVFRWMRFHAGGSYRFVSDSYFGSSNGYDLSGWAINFGIKLGCF